MADNGFVVQMKDGRQCPTMVCELCGESITDYRMAGAVWDERGEFENWTFRRVTVLCKENGCLSKPPYKGLPWQEMRDYLLWLAYNSGLKTEAQVREAWKEAEIMSNI